MSDFNLTNQFDINGLEGRGSANNSSVIVILAPSAKLNYTDELSDANRFSRVSLYNGRVEATLFTGRKPRTTVISCGGARGDLSHDTLRWHFKTTWRSNN